MVTYKSTDLIPIGDFAYAWRITDEKWDCLSSDVLQHIRPLTLQRGSLVSEQAGTFRYGGPFYVNTTHYHVTSDCSCRVDNSVGYENKVNHWLSQLPINPNEAVYVSWSNDVAIVTDWGTYKVTWDSLWYLDVLAVFDDSLEWAVLFGPEEFAVFVEKGAVNPDSTNRAYDSGFGLVSVASNNSKY